MADFQITALADIKVRLQNMFTDSRVNKDNGSIMPESFKAIAENQKINSTPIMAAGVCQGFKLWWIKPSCDDAACEGDLMDDLCDFTADDTMKLDEQDVDIVNFCDDKFGIAADICEDSNMIKFADKFAFELSEVFKRYERKMNTRAIGFLNANIDDNEFVSGPMTNSPGVGTIIAPSNWNASLMANLQQVAMMNKVSMPILLNGNNLWTDIWNAQFGKCCGDQGDAAKFNSFKNWYWDTFNLDQTLGENATFLWDAGSLAVLNEYHYMSPVPVEITADTHAYHIAHPTLKYMDNGTMRPMIIDVVRKRSCTTTSKGTVAANYAWHFRMRFEFLKSPVGCGGKLPLFKFLNQ